MCLCTCVLQICDVSPASWLRVQSAVWIPTTTPTRSWTLLILRPRTTTTIIATPSTATLRTRTTRGRSHTAAPWATATWWGLTITTTTTTLKGARAPHHTPDHTTTTINTHTTSTHHLEAGDRPREPRCTTRTITTSTITTIITIITAITITVRRWRCARGVAARSWSGSYCTPWTVTGTTAVSSARVVAPCLRISAAPASRKPTWSSARMITTGRQLVEAS